MSAIDAVKRRILSQVQLDNLVGESIQLTSRGGRKWGLCPFHQEKTASFTLYEDHYFCFGCRARGDIIDFAKHQYDLSFMEALRFLAKKYSIEAPELEESAAQRARNADFARHYRVLAAAHQHFRSNLLGPQGLHARRYLEKRGFTPEQYQSFELGLAVSDPQNLIHHLNQQRFATKEIVACSLAHQGQTSRAFDYFKNRLIIPIQDRWGRVIAFGGRTLGKDDAKYINSRETDVYSKSSTLFGFHRARESIKQKRRAIIVEGYMDALQLWAHGFPETVACLGTALTLEQLKLLAMSAQEVVLVFDGDAAGKQASLRTVSHAIETPQVRMKVVRLPGGQDPDQFVRDAGAETLGKLLDGAEDLLEFAITSELAETHDLGIPGIVKQKFIPWLASIHDPIQRAYLTNRIVELTGIPKESLRQRTQPAAAAPPKKPQSPLAAPALVSPLQGLEYEFFAHIYLSEPGGLDTKAAQELIANQLDLDETWVGFAEEMLACIAAGQAPAASPLATWNAASSEVILKWLQDVNRKASAFSVADRRAALAALSLALKRKSLKAGIMQLRKDLATPGIDREESLQILSTIHKLNQELTQIND